LAPLTLDIGAGEVVGIIGVNGAGKSTLLKLIAGTLRPSTGVSKYEGRLCALLELGAGFHPEMTGRENIYLGVAVGGQNPVDSGQIFNSIVDFSGLHAVIDQPVKTYSTGMMMRLAFSVATAVDPDILILDETLSVGDGVFARKSFQRIMGFKEAGKTILFCSHSMYQVQAICTRVLWLDRGHLRMDGDPAEVIVSYNAFMEELNTHSGSETFGYIRGDGLGSLSPALSAVTRLNDVAVTVDDVSGTRLAVKSGCSVVKIRVAFSSDAKRHAPCVAILLVGASGRPVASASTLNDRVVLERDNQGDGVALLELPSFPLLQGCYWIHVYLLCEQGLMVLDEVAMVAELVVSQESLEQGVVTLPHAWTDVMARTIAAS
jgi:lipopolysaccharide transport system ATP-binding protein